jgi:hypothetical protein
MKKPIYVNFTCYWSKPVTALAVVASYRCYISIIVYNCVQSITES